MMYELSAKKLFNSCNPLGVFTSPNAIMIKISAEKNRVVNEAFSSEFSSKGRTRL